MHPRKDTSDVVLEKSVSLPISPAALVLFQNCFCDQCSLYLTRTFDDRE